LKKQIYSGEETSCGLRRPGSRSRAARSFAKKSQTLEVNGMARSEYFHRERGVVCYSLPIFAAPERPYRQVTSSFKEAILAPYLEWCWRSSIRATAANDTESTSTDQYGALTRLSVETFAEFEEDIQYIDEWDNGKGIELFAYDPGMTPSIIDEDDHYLRMVLVRFAADEEGPLRLVNITVDDEDNSLVFVPHSPAPFVEKLLKAWGAPQARTDGWRKYKALGISKLETIYSLPPVRE
jgi:hypothetical protein